MTFCVKDEVILRNYLLVYEVHWLQSVELGCWTWHGWIASDRQMKVDNVEDNMITPAVSATTPSALTDSKTSPQQKKLSSNGTPVFNTANHWIYS